MFSEILAKAAQITWYYPVVGLCLITGIFFTFRMKFIQFRHFKHAIDLLRGIYDNPDEKGQITHFQALSAALSGTIGLGNIAGVAIAIAMGGPGAILWMWIIGLFGMATKFVECMLGTMYRDVDIKTRAARGGPMYFISKGLGPKWMPMAIFYGICTALGAFGAGCMFQANQAASALYQNFGINPKVSGLILAILVCTVILGGITRIGKVASKIVPTMCIIYLFGALLICIINYTKIPFVIWIILNDAFTGSAAAGGAVGLVIRWGIRRAVFSNEAGLGSASMAYAAVKTAHPTREGIVASLGPLIDTVIVCSATAIIIIMSGYYGTERFTNSGSNTISFENKNQTQMSLGWQITNKNIPVNTDKIRKYQDGNYALICQPAKTSQKALTAAIPTVIKNNSILNSNSYEILGDGIRFSSHQKNINAQINIRNQKNKIIAKLSLNPKGDTAYITINNQKRKLFSLNPFSQKNQWQSHVILFEEGFIELALKNNSALHKLKLEFIARPNSKEWFIDRIQIVKQLSDISLTISAFDKFFKGFGSIFITTAVFLFAFSTMITWSYYGETAAVFVFGEKIILPFKWAFIILIYIGSIYPLSIVLNFTDLMVGLMVIPNTIGILLLSNKAAHKTQEYLEKLKTGEFKRYK